jgi:glycerophosphoryl diester phosphodiesterase
MQKIQFLFGELSDELLERMKKYRMDVDIHYKHLTSELVKKFHDAGMEVNCWTVDDPLDAERLIEWGVDYITTNILE